MPQLHCVPKAAGRPRPAPEWYWRQAYHLAPTPAYAAEIFESALAELAAVRAAYLEATGTPAPRTHATRLELEADPHLFTPPAASPRVRSGAAGS